jgi:hypothetical protein
MPFPQIINEYHPDIVAGIAGTVIGLVRWRGMPKLPTRAGIWNYIAAWAAANRDAAMTRDRMKVVYLNAEVPNGSEDAGASGVCELVC